MGQETIVKQIVKYKGVYDLQGLIAAVISWLEKKGFEHYFYQTKTKTDTFGEEAEYGISGWYNETDYHRCYLDVYLHLWDANPVEVVENGVTKTLTKSALLIEIKGDFEMDWTGRFNGSKLMQKLRKFMESKVINDKYDSVWIDDHYFRAIAMTEHIKKYLKMSSQGKYW